MGFLKFKKKKENMKKPVMNPEFWKQRLSTSNELRMSVYNCHESQWQTINQHHYNILTNYIDVKNDKVLDAGCAFGRWSPLFSNYTGIDISPDFISLAKKNYPLHAENFICGDLKKMPWDNNSFDWCFTISTRAMIVREINQEAWDQIESELKRVAKKVLILECFGDSSLPEDLRERWEEILIK